MTDRFERSGDDFMVLWRDLDEAREARGWSRERLAQHVTALGRRRVSPKTLHDRMARGRRVSWDELRLVVLALGQDERAWRDRWHRVEAGRRASGSRPVPATADSAPHGGPVGATESGPVDRVRPGYGRRPMAIVAGTALGAALMLTTCAAIVGQPRYPDVGGDPAAPATANPTRPVCQPSVACGRVVTATAGLFRAPGDARAMAAKTAGQRVTMPPDRPLVVGADGVRYRMVLTSRTVTGYAFMRADALTDTPC